MPNRASLAAWPVPMAAERPSKNPGTFRLADVNTICNGAVG